MLAGNSRSLTWLKKKKNLGRKHGEPGRLPRPREEAGCSARLQRRSARQCLAALRPSRCLDARHSKPGKPVARHPRPHRVTELSSSMRSSLRFEELEIKGLCLQVRGKQITSAFGLPYLDAEVRGILLGQSPFLELEAGRETWSQGPEVKPPLDSQ